MTTPHQHVYRSTTVGTMITQQELIPTATMAPTISTQSRMTVIFVIMDYTITEQGEDLATTKVANMEINGLRHKNTATVQLLQTQKAKIQQL